MDVITPLQFSKGYVADKSVNDILNYVDGKQYKNEHIINWDNYNYTYLSDPTWTNTLGPNPQWTIVNH